jgi:hypothetical protein
MKNNLFKILYFIKNIYSFFAFVPEFLSHYWKIKINQEIQEQSGFYNGKEFVFFLNKIQGNTLIKEILSDNFPALISRHGSTELIAAESYDRTNYVVNLDELRLRSGFFPNCIESAKRWAQLYLDSAREIDCLCEWNFRFGRHAQAQHVFGKYHPQAKIINNLGVLTPFFLENPWTIALEGKRVVVVHPFEKTIVAQYQKRQFIFKNPKVFPELNSLHVIKAVQTRNGAIDPRFADWFEAYNYLCDEILKIDFDIALLGCGSYGLPLGSYIKRLGKKVVHIGGGLQLFFGIKGPRWEKETQWKIQELYNKHWVEPLKEDKDEGLKIVDNPYF